MIHLVGIYYFYFVCLWILSFILQSLLCGKWKIVVREVGQAISDGWIAFKDWRSGAGKSTKEYFLNLSDWFTGVLVKMLKVEIKDLSATWRWIIEYIGTIAAGIFVVGVVFWFVYPSLEDAILIDDAFI